MFVFTADELRARLVIKQLVIEGQVHTEDRIKLQVFPDEFEQLGVAAGKEDGVVSFFLQFQFLRLFLVKLGSDLLEDGLKQAFDFCFGHASEKGMEQLYGVVF